ncbi:Macrolide-specific efflux protein macA precursor [Sphingobacterium mizutaii]|uniref:Macrolide-specific efflux protein macA n=2 Tax=Sphingobacterium mizutaii TaxID=1010 RepID=A0AAJ5C0T4_9SPHI|nr:Multidrug resistance efflux pump [Sphingobacterium mizutaii]SNV51259.1 Macrolide-specific efflux protein macA precursor [Sphingobacterium mizutaii]
MLKKEMFQIVFEMRKITNSLSILSFLVLLLAVVSCKNEKKQKEEEKAKVSAIYGSVIAIGKVIPEDGWVQISSPVSAEIKEIRVKEGDEVEQGQVLMILKENSEELDVAQSQAQLESLKAAHQTNLSDLAKQDIILQELKSKYETSKALFAKNAETKEKVENDLSNLKQQEELISGLRSQIKANKASEKEQSILISKNKQSLQDYQITAIKKGVIAELNVQLGQTINGTEELGKIVDKDNIIIEAEVDELFADSVKIGQTVDINFVGKPTVIGKGKIVYVSPTLMNKSILFETANEAEDRRVRRIRIEPKKNPSLLINSKVECKVKL